MCAFTPFYHRIDDPAKMTISRLALASRGLALSSVAVSSAITWKSKDLIDLTMRGLSIAAMTTVMVVVLAWSSRHHGE